MSLNRMAAARAAALAFCATITFASNALAQPCNAVQRTTFLMGTVLRVSACAPARENAVGAIEAAFAETARLERVLSSWQRDSEIGRLNAAPANARVPLSGELGALLLEADKWVTATEGAFDPAVGALVDVWGFRSNARVPASDQLAEALRATGWQHARVEAGSIVRGPGGWWIDTGGFGKGAALRRIAALLREHGVEDAVVDFGGQLMVIGRMADIAVASPLDRNHATLSLRVRDVSVATTSQSERFVESGDKRFGHVLDPRTGEPVPAWGSVTVVMADALAADALSTALFVMGAQRALAWANEHPEVGVLVIEVAQNAVRTTWNRAMEPWLIRENVDVED